jgi:hypothetical protein
MFRVPRVARPLSFAVLLTSLALLACVNRGDPGGRTNPYKTTSSDERSSQANIPTLLEFSDQVSVRLAQDLVNIPQIQQAKTQVVLELGDIDNQTRTPTNDFELIQHRIRSALLQSQLIRSQFMVVESRQRMDRELDRVVGPGTAATSAGDQTARYSPEITYLLQGNFYEARRDERRQYFLEFTLTHLASRQIVFSHSYDLAQVKSD